MAAVTLRSELDVINGKDGSVELGWLAPNVLYTRFRGALIASTGHAYASRLNTLIAPVQSLCLFCDLTEIKYYDLLARSSFVRVVVSNRRKFSSITMLAPSDGLSQQSRAFVAMLGEPVEVLTVRSKFDVKLARKAPHGMKKIDPKYDTLPSYPARIVR